MNRLSYAHALVFGALAAIVCATPAAALHADVCYEEGDRPHLPPVVDATFRVACETLVEGAALERDGFTARGISALDRSIDAWDVPRARFVRARARLNRGLIEGALTDAWSATKSNAFGLIPDEVEALRAIEHYALDDALVHVVVSVADTSSVALDGRVVFTGPGQWHGLHAPGHITLQRLGAIPWQAVELAVGGQRLALELPAVDAAAPVPTLTLGPRRAHELSVLQERLVGFVVTYPRPAPLLADLDDLALPPDQARRCATTSAESARRICALHAEAHRQLVERINAIRIEHARILAKLQDMTR